jgi:tetratricopeptide (TPR) repeat protein
VNRQQRRAAAKGGGPSGNAPIALASTTTPAGNTDERFAVAQKLHQAGQLAQAEAIYRQILTIDPGHAGCLHLLGGIAFQTGHNDAAIDLIRKAIALNRRVPAFHCDLGTALQHQGELDEAVKSYRQALALKPDYAEALNNLGNVLAAQGKLDDAAKAYRRALALKPDYAEAHYNLGELRTREYRPDEALACYRRALDLKPDYAEPLNALGLAFQEQGELGEAAACYRKALDLKPDFAEAHFNHGLVLLLEGKLRHGWEEFEWRWRSKEVRRRYPIDRQWYGGDPNGRTILLHAEQGLGDSLQFVRYAPLLARLGATVLLEVQKPLVPLFSDMDGVSGVFAHGDTLPPFDTHCPFMSLPLALATTLDTIPGHTPYLRADPERAAAWRRRGEALPGLRVGLVWAGNPRPFQPGAHAIDRRRSITLDHFAEFDALEGVSFVSLQKGEAASQTKAPPAGLTIHDWTDELNDLADTAALVDTLDLVIGVDTSVIHLVGALAKPVWLLNRFDTCWRWLLERDDSPWYPTLRQFRQRSPGDWTGVLSQVHVELGSMIAARTAAGGAA